LLKGVASKASRGIMPMLLEQIFDRSRNVARMASYKARVAQEAECI
jgi:hypothetical protein